METPRTRYAKTVDGISIAYQVRGDGPVDLIYARGWTQNFEIELEGPRSGAWFGGLASFSRLILFDKRGTGCQIARGRPVSRYAPTTCERCSTPPAGTAPS